MSRPPFSQSLLRHASRTAGSPPAHDPRVEALVNDLIGRVADKWTMIALEVLAQHGELRFTQLARHMNGVSQKMLTQTLRQMERDGMVTRTVHAAVPPRVDYRLTDLGLSLGAAFCGVWTWAEHNLARVEAARASFDASRPSLPPVLPPAPSSAISPGGRPAADGRLANPVRSGRKQPQ